MAVTSDIGDKTDVHPTQKKQGGERLARWALADIYQLDMVKSGSLFECSHIEEKRIIISFNHGKALKTVNGKPVREIEIAGKDKIYFPAHAVINRDKLEVWNDSISSPVYVRYGWNSFSEGNLVNEENLPASTFSNEVE